jgi:hypothetical protein
MPGTLQVCLGRLDFTFIAFPRLHYTFLNSAFEDEMGAAGHSNSRLECQRGRRLAEEYNNDMACYVPYRYELFSTLRRPGQARRVLCPVELSSYDLRVAAMSNYSTATGFMRMSMRPAGLLQRQKSLLMEERQPYDIIS